MKVLTIKQPWASLIMCGAKDIENRTWQTGVRGRFAIHASARIDREEVSAACASMRRWIPKFSTRIFMAEALTYPAGVIIGTVELVQCVSHSESPWFVGPYGFLLRDPRLLKTPIPAKGKLGFWDYDLEGEF